MILIHISECLAIRQRSERPTRKLLRRIAPPLLSDLLESWRDCRVRQ
jgi:hypothetical protein